jgi:hypothetical protein
VQSVGQLDDQHAQVARHGHQHLAHRGGLLGFLRVELQSVEFRDTIHDAGDFIPERFGNVGEREFGVFYGVMQQRSDDGCFIETDVSNHGIRDLTLGMLRKVKDGTSKTISLAEAYSRAVAGGATVVSQYSATKGTKAPTFAHPDTTTAAPLGRANHPAKSIAPGQAGAWTGGFNALATGAMADVVAPPFQDKPAPADADGLRIQGAHPGTITIGMLDASVRNLSSDVDQAIFWSAVTPAGGEVGELP